MNLDEMISHAEEVAERKEKEAVKKINGQVSVSVECKECAAEHRQLAECLKELKQRRQMMQSLKDQIYMLKEEQSEKQKELELNQGYLAQDYFTGFISALSVVEGMIAEVENDTN